MPMRRLIIIVILSSLLKMLGCSGQAKKESNPTNDEIFKSLETWKNRAVYKELTLELISRIKDDELEQAIFDNISINMEGNENEEKEIVKTLTRGQRAIYVTWIVEGEVNNGGFNQFYFNSSGQLADMGEEAFRTIGANKYAELVKRANSIYEEIKEDLEKFNDGTTESFSKSYRENPLNDLDTKFYDLYKVEPLNQLKIKYISDNAKEFVN